MSLNLTIPNFTRVKAVKQSPGTQCICSRGQLMKNLHGKGGAAEELLCPAVVQKNVIIYDFIKTTQLCFDPAGHRRCTRSIKPHLLLVMISNDRSPLFV